MNTINTEQLEHLATEALHDLKAIDLVTLDVKKLTDITDVMLICSGRSTRHVTSLAENVVKKAKEAKVTYIRMEGQKEGEWVIVDLGDVIVHVMQPATRELYQLEDLWAPMKELRNRQS